MSVSYVPIGNNLGYLRDKLTGLSASIIFHVILFTVGGALLIKPVQYGIETGVSGIEIQLVAAPAEPVVEEVPIIPEIVPEPIVPSVIEKEMIEEIVPPKVEPVVLKIVEKSHVVPIQKKPVLTAKDAVEKGDGRSAVAGKNETTLHSSAGALTEAKPNYLKNPAPPYPWEAKKKGWEGTVLIEALIDKHGKTISVNIKKSSGYSILDETASKTVKKWTFQPARLGDLAVQSSAHVPIKFRLDDL
ncbi:MAG: energy transducer TonB [Candidatus Omnitrophica bacterium]|nr:energy transducer TonB [Candidatus Omnitrophota bacterium]